MFGSIAQSAREDRLVLTLSASYDGADFFIKFWDTNNNSDVLYEYEKTDDSSITGSGELLNGPYLTDIIVPSGGNYKLYVRPSGSNYGYQRRIKPNFGASSTTNPAFNNTNKTHLLSIDNWGNYPIYYSSGDAFYLCPNFDISASDCPLLYGTTSTSKNVSLYKDLLYS